MVEVEQKPIEVQIMTLISLTNHSGKIFSSFSFQVFTISKLLAERELSV